MNQPRFILAHLVDVTETISASRVRHGRAGGSQQDTRPMLRLFKTSFFWQFAGGFAIGAVGLFALQPAAQADPTHPTAVYAQR